MATDAADMREADTEQEKKDIYNNVSPRVLSHDSWRIEIFSDTAFLSTLFRGATLSLLRMEDKSKIYESIGLTCFLMA